MSLHRKPLLLTEMDDALRRAERSAGSGDAQDVSRHFAAHVRSGREPREFFHKELEDYHKAHEGYQAAWHTWNALGRHEVSPEARARFHAAWDNIEAKGKVLAAKAHATDHPVGQYLDWRGPKERIQTAEIHRALMHVSHDPKVQPPIGYTVGHDHQTGARHFMNANEASARHLEHGLKAQGLHTGLKRGQRDPNLIITGGR